MLEWEIAPGDGILDIASHATGSFMVATFKGELLFEPSLFHYYDKCPPCSAPTTLLDFEGATALCKHDDNKYVACGVSAIEVSVHDTSYVRATFRDLTSPHFRVRSTVAVGNWLVCVPVNNKYELVYALWMSSSERRMHQRLPIANCLCAHARDSMLALGTKDGLIILFNVGRAVFREVARFTSYLGLAVTHVHIVDEMTVVASSNLTDTESRVTRYVRSTVHACADIVLQPMDGQTGIVTGIDGNATHTVTCATDGTVRVWAGTTATCVRTITLADKRCTCLAFILPTMIAVGTQEGTVHLCAVPTDNTLAVRNAAEACDLNRYVLNFLGCQ